MTVPPGTPVDIAANSHLIKHAKGWMMFDTSTNDIIATMPNGFERRLARSAGRSPRKRRSSRS